VDAMLDEISPAELTEWMAYYELEPFGDAAAWYRHAGLMSTIQTLGGVKRVRPDDFLPDALISEVSPPKKE